MPNKVSKGFVFNFLFATILFSENTFAFAATPYNTDSVTPNHNWELRHNLNLNLLLAAMQISLGTFTPPVWTKLLLIKSPGYLSSYQRLHRICPCIDGGVMTACKPHGGAPLFSPPAPSRSGYLVRQGVQSGTPLPLQQSPPAAESRIEQNRITGIIAFMKYHNRHIIK